MDSRDPRKKSFRSLIPLLGVFVLLVATALITYGFGQTKIGYVRSNDLIGRYAGMIESRDIARKAHDQWNANLDTLNNDYRQALNLYNENFASLSATERKNREENLAKHREQIASYAQEVQKMAGEEDEKLMQGVLSQINSFVAVYGKENGYDMIFGTTAAGSLLYAGDGYDITDEVLTALNTQYKTSDDRNSAEK